MPGVVRQIDFGDGLAVTDLGAGRIRVDSCAVSPAGDNEFALIHCSASTARVTGDLTTAGYNTTAWRFNLVTGDILQDSIGLAVSGDSLVLPPGVYEFSVAAALVLPAQVATRWMFAYGLGSGSDFVQEQQSPGPFPLSLPIPFVITTQGRWGVRIPTGTGTTFFEVREDDGTPARVSTSRAIDVVVTRLGDAA